MPRPAHSGFSPGSLPAEVHLLLQSARWPFSVDEAKAAALLAATAIDWDLFLALCTHHRLAAIVHRAFCSRDITVPPAVLAALKRAATSNAMSTLGYLAETRRICELLRNAGVSARVLKGVPLSQRVYADPSHRDVGDIDLLISPGMEETADRVLMADGFRRSDPEAYLTPRRRRSWQKHGKDYTYLADRNGFEIDVHWRLFRNPYMPGNGLADPEAAAHAAPDELVQLGDTRLPVFSLERSFLFLCVHGALDGWFRFKSLVDVAALWRGFPTERKSTCVRLAKAYNILPELAAALVLAQQLELLDATAVDAPMHLQADCREARWILDYASRQHLAQHFQPMQSSSGSWQLKRYEWGLRRGFAYRFEIVRRILLRPRVWARFDLPDTLFPLYALLSPLEWLLFHRRVAPAIKQPRPNRWLRWRTLSRDQHWLLAESFVALLLARAAIAVLPMRNIFRWLERPVPLRGAQTSAEPAERVRWAILTVARYGPLSFVCFPQALAAHAMLRRRGVRSIMHYGVRRAADRSMRAHTWLEVDRRMLLGGESAVLFAPIHSTGRQDGQT